MPHYIGGYALLAAIDPLYVLGLLWVLTIGVLYPLRRLTEGAAYNVAYSSKRGDWGLIYAIFMLPLMLRHNVIPADSLVLSWGFHVPVMVICLMLGAAVAFVFRERSWPADFYRHLIVVPLFLYLLIIAAPVIFLHNSVWFLKAIAILGGAWWGIWFISDVREGRLDQRAWIKKNNLQLYRRLR